MLIGIDGDPWCSRLCQPDADFRHPLFLAGNTPVLQHGDQGVLHWAALAHHLAQLVHFLQQRGTGWTDVLLVEVATALCLEFAFKDSRRSRPVRLLRLRSWIRPSAQLALPSSLPVFTVRSLLLGVVVASLRPIAEPIRELLALRAIVSLVHESEPVRAEPYSSETRPGCSGRPLGLRETRRPEAQGRRGRRADGQPT